MFCKNCGSEINEGTAFCTNCGHELRQTNVMDNSAQKTYYNEAQDTSKIYASVKPTFNWLYKFFQKGWEWALVALYIGFSFEFEVMSLDTESFRFNYETLSLLELYPFQLILGTLLAIFIHMVLDKMQYNKIQYDFYIDRVEYKDGFLNVSQKELKYKFIREVTMTKSIIERMFNLGTIHLYTNASSGMRRGRHNASGGNGLALHCISDIEQVLPQIKKLIDSIESDND